MLLYDVVQKPLDLPCARNRKGLKMLTGNAVLESCELSLIGDSGQSSEDQNVDSNEG